MLWRQKHFSELTTTELYGLLQLRAKVFVVEQRCAYLDLDDYDQKADHLWAEQPDTSRIVACVRMFNPGIKYQEASIGRVVTDPDVRRTGLGKELVKRAVEAATTHYGNVPIRIGAQRYLERFYGYFGFRRAGPDYLEDGIIHVEMVRPANTKLESL